MSELATITNLCDRAKRTGIETIQVSPSALLVAVEYCRSHIRTASLAEEWIVESEWRNQEAQLHAALGEYGLKTILRSDC